VKTAQLNFLVVEDHDFQRETLVELLRALQAQNVYSASDGQAALDLLAQPGKSVDVILCDLEMPGMDGLEFMRHVGKSGFHGSVIVASAMNAALLTSTESMAKAYGINFLGAIAKPVTRNALEPVLAYHGVPMPRANAPSRSRASFTLEEILHGLEHNEFEPYFQPKVELATRRVVGAEALARWRHPQHGLVFPESFVKVLENAGKIDELTWVMLRKSASFSASLQAAGMESLVSVNLSLKSLGNVELGNRIAEIIRAHNVEAARICLEITETAATTNLGLALENLTRLRMKGFGLSIDDYGTGYSTMQQLTRIPFTELKIDRSFVTNSATNDAARVILSTSIEIARKLKIKAVAEGVETQQDWDMLQELGCDLAQGFFIARPMEASAYVTWATDLATNATSMFIA
jgi:EAL domain-containing protein (putative c-di-GMP-specific phosphodiesterase class I)